MFLRNLSTRIECVTKIDLDNLQSKIKSQSKKKSAKINCNSTKTNIAILRSSDKSHLSATSTSGSDNPNRPSIASSQHSNNSVEVEKTINIGRIYAHSKTMKDAHELLKVKVCFFMMHQ